MFPTIAVLLSLSPLAMYILLPTALLCCMPLSSSLASTCCIV